MTNQYLRNSVADHITGAISACDEEAKTPAGVPDHGAQWLELNATRKEFSLRLISVGQEVVIVIGENMNEERIRGYLERE